MEIHQKEKSDLILLLYFQMRKKFTKVWFTAIRKTNYKYMYNDIYSHFVQIPILWTNLVDLVSPVLYTKSQPQSFLGSGEENIKSFYHNGHGSHLVQWCGTIWTVLIPFWQKAQCEIWWNLLKRFQRRHLKIHNFIHAYSLRTEQITPAGANFDCNYKVLLL